MSDQGTSLSVERRGGESERGNVIGREGRRIRGMIYEFKRVRGGEIGGLNRWRSEGGANYLQSI